MEENLDVNKSRSVLTISTLNTFSVPLQNTKNTQHFAGSILFRAIIHQLSDVPVSLVTFKILISTGH